MSSPLNLSSPKDLDCFKQENLIVQQFSATRSNILKKSGEKNVKDSNFRQNEVNEQLNKNVQELKGYEKNFPSFCEKAIEVPSSDHVAEIVGTKGLYRFVLSRICYRFAHSITGAFRDENLGE